MAREDFIIGLNAVIESIRDDVKRKYEQENKIRLNLEIKNDKISEIKIAEQIKKIQEEVGKDASKIRVFEEIDDMQIGYVKKLQVEYEKLGATVKDTYRLPSDDDISGEIVKVSSETLLNNKATTKEKEKQLSLLEKQEASLAKQMLLAKQQVDVFRRKEGGYTETPELLSAQQRASEIAKKLSSPIPKTKEELNSLQMELKELSSDLKKSVLDLDASQKKFNAYEKSVSRAKEQIEKFRSKEGIYKSSEGLDKTRGIVGDLEKQVAIKPGSADEASKYATSLNALTTSARTSQAALEKTGEANWSFTQKLGAAIQRVAAYTVAMGGLYAALAEVRRGIEYIKDLNKEMTDIQIVTGMSNSEIGKMTSQFNELGKEIGATTLEVARGSLEWFLNRPHKTLLIDGKILRVYSY